MAQLPEDFLTVCQGDARNLNAHLSRVSSAESPALTCTITSPPYGALKNYGVPGQIGFGQSYDDYLRDMRQVFAVLFQHTREDGSLWLVADTLRPSDRSTVRRLVPLPFHLAMEAEREGWILRDIVVWHKDKTLPWSGRGRLRNAFEYVLLFVKGPHFKYYVDRVRDRARLAQWWVQWPERYNPLGKVPTNVWHFPIPVQGTWGSPFSHACPLPPDLVERLIALSSDPGDVVFDPFAGVGTVVGEANRLGRQGAGLELNPTYVDAYREYLREELASRTPDANEDARANEWLRRTIARLRAVKYPKTLIKQLPSAQRPLAAVVLTQPKRKAPLRPHDVIAARVLFLSEGDIEARESLRIALKDAALRPPASKMGVAAEIEVVGLADWPTPQVPERLWFYTGTRTWWAQQRVGANAVIETATQHPKDGLPPIFSDIYLRERPRPLGEDY